MESNAAVTTSISLKFIELVPVVGLERTLSVTPVQTATLEITPFNPVLILPCRFGIQKFADRCPHG